jgi:uncharacterized protein YbaR (Trm112 family)
MYPPRLIQRKKPLSYIEGQFVCPECNSPLTPPTKRGKEYQDFAWCPKCKDWYYLKGGHKRITPYKIQKESYFGEGTTAQLREKMTQYEQRFQKQQASTIKTWTGDEYSQEFLQSLIPKK